MAAIAAARTARTATATGATADTAPATAPAATVPRAVMPYDAPLPDDVTAQAHRLLADTLPRGEAEVSRVLLMAASAYRPTQDSTVAAAARTTRIRDAASLASVRTSATVEARRLHTQALIA